MSADYQHQSVLTKEVIDYLQPRPGQNFIDSTLGGGGHSEELLKKNKPGGKVLALEIDPHAVVASQRRLARNKDRIIIVKRSYVHLKEIWSKYKNTLPHIDGIVIDLGLSSDQLDRANRGFSFSDQGPLDMRFDPGQKLTASEIILTWSESELVNMFRKYGEIPNAKHLSHGLVTWRQDLAPSDFVKQKQKLLKTSAFVSAILRISYIPERELPRFRRHPATLVFQALRLAVNHELENLEQFLPQALEILRPGGRLAVISFHSLEDRIVKDFFKDGAKDCICPPQNPICNCNHRSKLKILIKKIIQPGAAEIKANPRSRSAKLRVIEKI
ncbi:MAG: 16S rRNA (cytosine(1402)-N(4))-methyltransferase [Parcubacteria group bacterium]|nr:MAG: 16S rRNA (cytosine(1402)-N(4))-methyltransferase [Parcubacteria group bacterium]